MKNQDSIHNWEKIKKIQSQHFRETIAIIVMTK